MESALLKDLSDEELLTLVKEQGNSDAALELINRVYGFIKYKAAQFAASYGLERQDFCQQGMMGVLRAMRKYNPEKEAKFTTYACTCALRSMNKLCDQQKNENVPTFSLTDIFEKDFPEDTYDDIRSYELIADLTEKIKTRLSDFEKKVLAMYVRGESYASIAKKTGKSVKSIDNAIQRIRRKLKAD
ncbi:MAG: sigma-70 family RNA polymerase sigma factor [Clostridia bacterium]|nr:sigma-70 family RNA polymerase sigma factor [Clostridia bacterium]